mgnify:CR=1 FL=1
MASKIKVDQIEGSTGSTITIPTGQTLTITDGIAASNIGSGTLASARLPTVPVSKGGTGLTSLGSAGQVIQVASGGSTLEFATASSGGLVRIKSVTSTTAHSFSGSTGNPGTTMSGMVAMSSLINDFTPTNASNTLVITAHVVTWKGANGQLFMGIKDTTNTTYLGVGGDYYNSAGSGISGNITIRAVISAGSTTARNYQVFMGATMGGTHAINKDYHGNNNGISSIVVEEYAAAVVA